MRTAAQKAQENFNSRSAGKSDQEKEQIAQEIQRDMAAKERTAMQPILQDIRKAIQQVRQEKGLDVILEAGAVIDGGTDVTSEVGANSQNNLKMKKRPFGVSFLCGDSSLV